MAATPLDRDDLRARVSAALRAHLHRRRGRLALVGPELGPVADALADFLDGGKRLRPAFAYWGYRAAGGHGSDALVRAVGALELVQACALIHDDVMDGSDTRRGKPAVHRHFEALHRAEKYTGSAERFGTAAAILLGDVCLIWADEMLDRSGMPADALERARPIWDEMRTEIMAGQYLDVLAQAQGGHSVDRAVRVVRYKAAKYTVERPLHLGAALAGAGPDLLDSLSRYGLPIGEAFQLRDDVLGVFGDPAETGKPAGDDLREGKRTLLLAYAAERATTAQHELLDRHLGDPDLADEGVDALRGVLVETGALARTEERITSLTQRALDALRAAPVDAEAAEALAELAAAATARRA
ncbi:polyprenyl synthetase family protein [Cryptosporangium phraense]|uniref:Polyprenyl synthetase family protein n=1 Tax=Cryptosporangium phraense TaxID=2593070 RepID=A0A545AJY9_9ACTN|nr:polyprenyl synthetase family protein [Cryptosporangium phraense]TQS41560.1 polyprenyl synthetase family protein [Cryptosporangium phraense]